MESESEEEAKDREDGFLFNSDDEAVVYYSNNKVKKIFKKPFSGKFMNNSEKTSVISTRKSVNNESKVEKKYVKSAYKKKKELKLKRRLMLRL